MSRTFDIPILRQAPVTAACVAVCLALFLFTGGLNEAEPRRLELLDQWGAVVPRPYAERTEQALWGPLALWQGELWRIPISSFHHGDFWHLFINCALALYLGRYVERYYGSRNFLRLLPALAILPPIPEFLMGYYLFGFSGVVTGMFGLLCVLRMADDDLREEFSDETSYLGLMLFAMGVFAFLLGERVALLAHATGFLVGALAGGIATGIPLGRKAMRGWQIIAYTLAMASLYFVSHPVWSGAYHWYLARQATELDRRERELKLATELDPGLVGAYKELAAQQAQVGDELAAWRTLLTAVSNNPGESELFRVARRNWQRFEKSPRRKSARDAVTDIFGEFAEDWMARLNHRPGPEFLHDLLRQLSVADVDPEVAFPLDRAVDLRLPDLTAAEWDRIRPRLIPPDGDAVEGRRM